MNRPGYWKTYYQDNKEKKDAQSRQWALDNPESIQDTQKRWEMRNPGRRKAISRKRTLRIKNLTAEQYDAMVVLQGNRCAICGCTDTGRWKHWHIDHCHETGAVRGLLCNNCNSGIGMLRDNAVLLRAAADYIERHQCQTNNNPTSTPPTSTTAGPPKHLQLIASNEKPCISSCPATSSQNLSGPSRKSA